MHNINAMPSYIPLGNQRDFGHALVFDVSAWADLLPDRYEITCIRSGETVAYPVVGCVFDSAAQTLTWTVSAVDTGISGSGSLVIEAYRADEQLIHTPMVQTIVGAGHEPAGEAPEPVTDWVSDATAKLAEVDPALGLAADATLAANTAATLASEKAAIAAQAATDADNAHIVSAEFVDDDIVLTTQGADEIILAGAATTLKGDTGPSAYDAAVAGEYMGTEAEFNAANAGIEAAKDAALGAAETANDAAENAETAAYRSMLWRKTASGNPVSVYPAPGSPLYPKVSGSFAQAGTGDPSPSNIRPITPWLSSGGIAKVKRMGKNLIDILAIFKVYTTSSITVLSNGVRITNAYGVGISGAGSLISSKLIPGVAYTLSRTFTAISGTCEAASGRVALFNPTTSAWLYLIASKDNASGTFTPPSNISQYTTLFIYGYGTGVIEHTNFQLEFGSVATPYEPYTEQEITLTAPQEIPAGWMDNEGKGQVTHGYIASYVDETVPDGWVSSIGELSAGAQVVYSLATPIDITPTAAPLASLAQVDRVTPRKNVLTATTGNVELTYAKSPIREADDIAAAIAAL